MPGKGVSDKDRSFQIAYHRESLNLSGVYASKRDIHVEGTIIIQPRVESESPEHRGRATARPNIQHQTKAAILKSLLIIVIQREFLC